MAQKIVKDFNNDTYNIYSTIVDDYLLKKFCSLDEVLSILKKWEIEELELKIARLKKETLRKPKNRKEFDNIIKLIHQRD